MLKTFYSLTYSMEIKFKFSGSSILNRCEAVIVYFEWAVDCLSQFQLISIASYLWETSIEKAKRLGFPPELLVEEETTMEEEDDQ